MQAPIPIPPEQAVEQLAERTELYSRNPMQLGTVKIGRGQLVARIHRRKGVTAADVVNALRTGQLLDRPLY